MNEELLETWRHSHSLWLSRTWGLLALEAVQAGAALGEGAGSMDAARLCWRTGWRALDQHRIGRWPQGWAEFTAGMVVLSQETPGPGTVQERASCSEWQPPLWERRSQQVCRGLFLTKNAAVGKGSQALSGAQEDLGPLRAGTGGYDRDSCRLSLRPGVEAQGPGRTLGAAERKGQGPRACPLSPQRRTPSRHLEKVLVHPPHPTCPPRPVTPAGISGPAGKGGMGCPAQALQQAPSAKGTVSPEPRGVTSTGLGHWRRFREPVQG